MISSYIIVGQRITGKDKQEVEDILSSYGLVFSKTFEFVRRKNDAENTLRYVKLSPLNPQSPIDFYVGQMVKAGSEEENFQELSFKHSELEKILLKVKEDIPDANIFFISYGLQ